MEREIPEPSPRPKISVTELSLDQIKLIAGMTHSPANILTLQTELNRRGMTMSNDNQEREKLIAAQEALNKTKDLLNEKNSLTA